MRLLLRAFRDEDVDPLYEIQGDPHTMRYSFRPASRDACARWLDAQAERREVQGFAPWTVVLRAERRVIGWGGLGVDPYAPEWGVEVSYFFHPAYWGRGYATELVQHALAHGFGPLGLDRVVAFARPSNAASIRVLEKCGFRWVAYEPGLERNHYAADRGAWLAPRSNQAPGIPSSR